jgi:hypothetical protein
MEIKHPWPTGTRRSREISGSDLSLVGIENGDKNKEKKDVEKTTPASP